MLLKGPLRRGVDGGSEVSGLHVSFWNLPGQSQPRPMCCPLNVNPAFLGCLLWLLGLEEKLLFLLGEALLSLCQLR